MNSGARLREEETVKEALVLMLSSDSKWHWQHTNHQVVPKQTNSTLSWKPLESLIHSSQHVRRIWFIMSQYTKSSLFLLVLTRIWKLPEWSSVIYHFASTFLLNRIFSWTGKGGILINSLNF